MTKLKLSLFVLLAFFAPIIYSSQTLDYPSQLNFFSAGHGFETDGSFTLVSRFSTSSSGAPSQIFIPRETAIDRSDLPVEIYMCPGNLMPSTTPSGTFYKTSFSGDSFYILPNKRTNFVCFKSADYDICIKESYPWPADQLGKGTQIQWSTSPSPTILDKMKADSNFKATVDPQEALYNELCTNANVNVDYYPALAEEFYPDNEGKAGVACSGSEKVYVKSGSSTTPLVRADGKSSPAPINSNSCNPPSSQNWQSYSFADNKQDTITLGSITYKGQNYEVLSELDTGTLVCHGAIQILPYKGDKYDAKYLYLSGGASPTSQSASKYVVHVVEPGTCNLPVISFSPNPLTGVSPNGQYTINVDIKNPYLLFDMDITGVRMSPYSPVNGWSAKIDSLPIKIESDKTVSVPVVLTSPAQLTSLDDVCFNISYTSSVPFCDGKKCTNSSLVCVKLDLTPSCKIFSLTVPPIKTGDSTILNTTCYEDGYVFPCEPIEWVASGFEDKSGNQNISFFALGAQDYIPQNVPALDSKFIIVPPYTTPPYTYPAQPAERKFFTANPAPWGMLWTYDWHDKPSITPEAPNGKISASGTNSQKKSFTCEFDINAAKADLPDFTPDVIITPSGDPLRGTQQYLITYSAFNKGLGASPSGSDVENVLRDSKNAIASKTVFSESVAPLKKSKAGTYTFQCPFPGFFKFFISVDDKGVIDEEKEDNNKGTIDLRCDGLYYCPDLV
ncbi:MAG: hypothetical protein WC492_00290 [Candidatus Micrarchaeia archaeon]